MPKVIRVNLLHHKREFGIALLFLGIGILSTKVYEDYQIKQIKALAYKFSNNCLGAVQAQRTIINTCDQAYRTLGDCVSNLDSCNIPDATQKLHDLNTQNTQAENHFNDLAEQLSEWVNQK